MKTVILCGGLGTRLSEETKVRPKPMVEVGDKPILWHIMKIYDHFGFTDFVLPLGYKGYYIKEYFLNYRQNRSDVCVNLLTGKIAIDPNHSENWHIAMSDTGANTLTGGRLHRLEAQLNNDTFMLTYGDGLANVDIKALLAFHRAHGKIATVTAVRPPARFGGLSIVDGCVKNFREKSQVDAGWINGGFFVFEPAIFQYLHGDDTILERDPLEKLSKDNQLMAYQHDGFWHPMDTLRDKRFLNELWDNGNPPWRMWRQQENPTISKKDREFIDA